MTSITHRSDTVMSVDAAASLELTIEPGEYWWGGAVEDGRLMPFGVDAHARDLGMPSAAHEGETVGRPSNQSAPLLVSTRGRVVASRQSFTFSFSDGILRITGDDVVTFRAGSTLRDAFLAASARFFPPSGQRPPRELFDAPQYNTWIEHPYRPTQHTVLQYARSILDAGMEPGVLIIDDSWSPDYGTWIFDSGRFPDPRAMVEELHECGFRVMLWLVPFVSPDSAAFRELEAENLLIRDQDGDTAIRRWWNGLSALLDLSNGRTVEWLTNRLDDLIDSYGVDGFKFDGGDVRDFRSDDILARPLSPTEMCEEWARIGLRYPFNEYRACWRMGGQPLAQRLQDKPPTWDDHGIRSLIPEMLAQGMIGHPFVCPDMIGGGEIGAVSGQSQIDQEFFVRYAQVAALSPMAQFSKSPAKVLDAAHLALVEQAMALRAHLLPLILELADAASRTGEPILRPMAYHAPNLAHVNDQFFLGPDLFAAPVLEPGARVREVAVPAGRWIGPNESIVEGPATIAWDCELATIPWFRRGTATTIVASS